MHGLGRAPEQCTKQSVKSGVHTHLLFALQVRCVAPWGKGVNARLLLSALQFDWKQPRSEKGGGRE